MVELTTKRKRVRPEIVIVCLLLLLPVGLATYCFLPQYYAFSAPGEIVSVQKLGVSGSVNFTYVRQGFTSNRYERWSTERAFPEAYFEPASSSIKESFTTIKDTGGGLRDETIRNAITSAEEEADHEASGDEFELRLEKLIEESTDYYGDSLGLMLAIGLVEEAHGEDFSHEGQYIIAGTGTMESDHTVGSVGGIRDKLRTAENAGVDYFFLPKDKEHFYYEGLSNEEEAELVVEELNLKLKVVPVETMEDALGFLRNLK
ncbi:hypothetical protein [Cohnella abietis]|uniref:Lon proteolytic domain-containing protein n=1 Tax=Cohnella abietis TaxID=2507935 RepID=A0A3T1CYV2_9BACL|nr:hypothetical protein [Cohnella abietis]BBI31037.1 hypothetical protein KCTCHS21_04360 [Cohnella abietis]